MEAGGQWGTAVESLEMIVELGLGMGQTQHVAEGQDKPASGPRSGQALLWAGRQHPDSPGGALMASAVSEVVSQV